MKTPGLTAQKKFSYVWWARDTSSPRGLSRAQRSLLKELASRSNARGCCHPSVALLADAVALSEGHTKRVLRQLEDLGLVSSTRRGRGRTAERQLCPSAPMPRAAHANGTLALFDRDMTPLYETPTAAAAPSSEVSFAASEVSSDETQKYVQPEVKRQQQGTHTPAHPNTALSPSLPAVLEILSLAPTLVVEDMPVDTALRAFPAADHLQAAYRVVTLALEDGLEHLSASRQLWRALERQMQAPSAGRGTSPHSGRRRTAPAGVSPAGRRWGPTGGKYNRAAGLV